MSDENIEGPEAPITITLKGGSGYDKPWLVLRAVSAPDALALLAEAELNELPGKIAEFAASFQEKNGAAPQTSAPARSSGSPSRSQGAPRGAAPQQQQQSSDVEYHPEGLACSKCQGDVQLKTITSKKNGKKYDMWVCPNQSDRNDGHHSEFIN